MKKLFVLSLVLFIAGSVGVAAAAPSHGGGGHVGGGFHGSAASGGFRGGFHDGFHGHPGFHHGFRSHVFVGGPVFFWDPWPVYVAPPPVVQAPPEYVSPPVAGYWYYCSSAGGYYPTVPSCPEPWVPVPPTGG
jgi:hypothetical protein